MAGGIYSYLLSHFFTPSLGEGGRGGEKKITTVVQPRGDDSQFSDGGHEDGMRGWEQLLGSARLCHTFYLRDRKGHLCGWKKRKLHQTLEGRLLSKLCPHRVLGKLELD